MLGVGALNPATGRLPEGVNSMFFLQKRAEVWVCNGFFVLLQRRRDRGPLGSTAMMHVLDAAGNAHVWTPNLYITRSSRR